MLSRLNALQAKIKNYQKQAYLFLLQEAEYKEEAEVLENLVKNSNEGIIEFKSQIRGISNEIDQKNNFLIGTINEINLGSKWKQLIIEINKLRTTEKDRHVEKSKEDIDNLQEDLNPKYAHPEKEILKHKDSINYVLEDNATFEVTLETLREKAQELDSLVALVIRNKQKNGLSADELKKLTNDIEAIKKEIPKQDQYIFYQNMAKEFSDSDEALDLMIDKAEKALKNPGERKKIASASSMRDPKEMPGLLLGKGSFRPKPLEKKERKKEGVSDVCGMMKLLGLDKGVSGPEIIEKKDGPGISSAGSKAKEIKPLNELEQQLFKIKEYSEILATIKSNESKLKAKDQEFFKSFEKGMTTLHAYSEAVKKELSRIDTLKNAVMGIYNQVKSGKLDAPEAPEVRPVPGGPSLGPVIEPAIAPPGGPAIAPEEPVIEPAAIAPPGGPAIEPPAAIAPGGPR
jgi:hypothetical protein